MPICEMTRGEINYTHNGVVGQGVHLVLIHGAGGQTRVWPATWRQAAAAAGSIGLSIGATAERITNHSIYAIDLPGHGGSPGPALTSIAALGDVVEAFINALDLNCVVAVGHSMGGLIALELARRANPRVAGQVIIASAARIGVTDAILDGLQKDFAQTVDFIVKYSFDRAAPPFFPRKAREYTLAAGPESTHADFAACAAADLRADLGAITLPTLVIGSDGDRMIPLKHTAALAETLPNARLETVTGCGHYPHLDRTTLVERPIAGFCAEVAEACR